MLRLKNIVKKYKVADSEVFALKGINLSFRQNEFVSILGPSGCGKTTTLNIIGGLDKYTEGDLYIGGKSTKNFNDHDWDVYRNHRIGFIFQSYNLIPHQTILENVELALTISGVEKKEREIRARKALDKVGLKGQYKKKPNQLSGGQCQRVAIARALVNEPDILLADEPTGALDTHTSIQIMELIKEISKEKLVIMVTHNPELAEKYSTRIVRLLDGELKDDSNPFSEEEEIEECELIKKKQEEAEYDEKKEKKERAKMSLFTAIKLSSRNLYSKFKRTLMVAIAGSIGIVGVSTVLSVSNGIQGYISDMQNDMLSGYPVFISSSSFEYASLLGGQMNTGSTEKLNPNGDLSQAYVNSLVRTLYNMNGITSTNVITEEYMDFIDKMPSNTCSLVQNIYGDLIAPNLFTSFKTGYNETHMMSVSAIQATYASVLKGIEEYKDYANMISSVDVMTEMPSNADYIASQYDILYIEDGMTLKDVIESKEALVAVTNKKTNSLNDLELAEYGFFDQDVFINYCLKVGNSPDYIDNGVLELPQTLSYEQIAKKVFTWYPNRTVFKKSGSDDDLGPKYYCSAYADGSLMNDPLIDETYQFNAFTKNDGAVDLNVKCILRLKDELSYGCLLSGGLLYTKALTDHIREYNKNSQIVLDAKDNDNVLYNIEMGFKYRFDDKSSSTCEKTYLSADSSSAILEYVAQFMGGGSNKTIKSYSMQALGGSDYPTSLYFYCKDFKEKDNLLLYLDKWNSNIKGNLYKVDTSGLYVGMKYDENGKENTVYYYKNVNNDKYFEVILDENGYVTDTKGRKYKFFNTDEGVGFYERIADRIGKSFLINDNIEIEGTSLSINPYSLLKYSVLKEEFTSSNIFYNSIKRLYSSNDYIWYYDDRDGFRHYVMRVEKQDYYKINLDAQGNVIVPNDGYQKYAYIHDDVNDKWDFYKYEYNSETGAYSIGTTPVEEEDYDNIYADNHVYSYLNVVKNPEFKIDTDRDGVEEDWMIDTKGFYIDLSSLQNMDISSTGGASALLDSFIVDSTNKILTIRDYSAFNFYFRAPLSSIEEERYIFNYVDVEEETIVDREGKTNTHFYLLAKDISKYAESNNLDSISGIENILGDKYLIEEEGGLKAVSKAFSDTPLSLLQLIDNNIIGDELQDLSVLTLDDGKKINYTDSIGLIMGMVNDLINIITYALVAFTALSLVVSTVMIGIITYVSVVERTKEIGVIRSLGGRKKDVAHLFNAETLIIGFSSGLVGILVTYGLSALINVVVGSMTGIYTIASLSPLTAVIMVVLSVLLTTISGLIPSRAAAKKDPVVALRTE